MLRMKKRYRLINFICLLAAYKKMIGTGRVFSGMTRYAYSQITFTALYVHRPQSNLAIDITG